MKNAHAYGRNDTITFTTTEGTGSPFPAFSQA